jgi:hypothetical protein
LRLKPIPSSAERMAANHNGRGVRIRLLRRGHGRLVRDGAQSCKDGQNLVHLLEGCLWNKKVQNQERLASHLHRYKDVGQLGVLGMPPWWSRRDAHQRRAACKAAVHVTKIEGAVGSCPLATQACGGNDPEEIDYYQDAHHHDASSRLCGAFHLDASSNQNRYWRRNWNLRCGGGQRVT